MFVQMIDYFESNHLLHPNHHGFRANHTTTTALLQMYDTWVEAMDRGEATAAVFLDMSAAFDMVSHPVLLDKLLLYGFDEASFKWIKSYLSDRKQSVCIDGTCSSMLPLDFGVPQGSIVGPLLYIIFTNDLPESVHNHHNYQEYPPPQDQQQQQYYNMYCSDCGGVCCFADDSSYTYSNKVAEEITDKVSDQYNKISEYMASHELKLNGDKTHLLLLMSDESRRAKPNFNITLETGAETIETSKSEKLLGGIVAQNLKFTEHIQNNKDSMLKILNSRLNGLKKVGKAASFKSRKMIANGIIMSRLIYLIPWWSGCEQYLMKSLQIIQNKAARVVTRARKRTTVKNLLSQCGWLSVAQLSVYHSLVLVYKILSTKSPQYLYSKLSQVNDSHYKMRSAADKSKIRLGSDSQADAGLARRSFKYRATREWNLLPQEIRQLATLKVFKMELKKCVLSNIPIS